MEFNVVFVMANSRAIVKNVELYMIFCEKLDFFS